MILFLHLLMMASTLLRLSTSYISCHNFENFIKPSFLFTYKVLRMHLEKPMIFAILVLWPMPSFNLLNNRTWRLRSFCAWIFLCCWWKRNILSFWRSWGLFFINHIWRISLRIFLFRLILIYMVVCQHLFNKILA